MMINRRGGSRFEKRYNKNAKMPTMTNPINNLVVEPQLGEDVDV
jgi:hypothetical protein